MRWRLLQRVRELVPGQSALAEASADFPEELFADHFPSFPVAPGVLLTEMGAQLSGLLVQATLLSTRSRWTFPFLGMIEGAKFRSFVRPNQELEVRTRIDSMRDEGALCKARIVSGATTCADMTLLLVFDPEGGAGTADRNLLQEHARSEYQRLCSPWLPPDRP